VAVASAALSQPMMSSSWRGRLRESRRHSGQPFTPRGMVAAAQTGADAPVVLRAGACATAMPSMVVTT
jgi:hypothetical protein